MPGGCFTQLDLQPHRSRYWLNPPPTDDPVERDARITDVCTVYRTAPERAAHGERTVCTDELTGVQALERAAPDQPMRPGQVRRREFEYRRHGTCSFIITFDVVTGQVVCPSSGPTRTEADFLAHIQQTVASDSSATRWHFVVDNLNTHCSESLVRYVAAHEGLDPLTLGEKAQGGKPGTGILQNRASRTAFLQEPTHRVVFHYTPKHASWLNQVEIWLGILVRKVLRRGSFPSVAALQQRVTDFIAYFNRTMAHPFQWTFQGKPLRV